MNAATLELLTSFLLELICLRCAQEMAVLAEQKVTVFPGNGRRCMPLLF